MEMAFLSKLFSKQQSNVVSSRANPSPDSKAHVLRGLALYDLNQYEEALAEYDKAIRLNPQDAEAHFHRGNALRALGRYHEAVAAWEEATRLDPWIAITMRAAARMKDIVRESNPR